LVAGGTHAFSFDASNFYASNSQGGGIANATASTTVPTLLPRRGITNTGFGSDSGFITAVVSGGHIATINSTGLDMANAAGPALLNEAATSTNPTLVPNKADPSTGIGWDFASNMDIIAGGVRLLNTDTAGLYMRVNGSVTVPAIRMNAPNGGIYIPAAGETAISVGGSQKLHIDANTGSTGGASSAGAGNQYVELKINGNRYKLLHDGTI